LKRVLQLHYYVDTFFFVLVRFFLLLYVYYLVCISQVTYKMKIVFFYIYLI
jgi:hypothetical protein